MFRATNEAHDPSMATIHLVFTKYNNKLKTKHMDALIIWSRASATGVYTRRSWMMFRVTNEAHARSWPYFYFNDLLDRDYRARDSHHSFYEMTIMYFNGVMPYARRLLRWHRRRYRCHFNFSNSWISRFSRDSNLEIRIKSQYNWKRSTWMRSLSGAAHLRLACIHAALG